MKVTQAYTAMFTEYPDAVHIEDATKMLRMSRHKVSTLIQTQQLFAFKVGRTYLIPKSSVIELLLNGKSSNPYEQSEQS